MAAPNSMAVFVGGRVWSAGTDGVDCDLENVGGYGEAQGGDKH